MASPREPVQARARARREAVLDAASRLAERGLDTLAVADIAREAAIAAGTLYQYFDGVDGVIDAVIERHLERFDAIIIETFARNEFADATAASLSVVRAFVRYYRREPGFRALWFGPAFTGRRRALDAANNARLIETMHEQLAVRHLIPRNREARAVVAANWELSDAVVGLAFRMAPNGDTIVLRHLERVLAMATRTSG